MYVLLLCLATASNRVLASAVVLASAKAAEQQNKASYRELLIVCSVVFVITKTSRLQPTKTDNYFCPSQVRLR
jgi:hypothetical protein